MKNIKSLYILSVLCSLLALSYANAQDCSETTGYSVSAYNSQIDTRLQTAYNALNSVSIDLQSGNGSQPANYIVLDDRDFYGQNTGGYGSRCQWEFIDAAYPTTDVDIDDITYFILTPGDYRDYLTFNPRFSNNSSIDHKKYLLYYPGSIGDSEQTIENYLNGVSETPKAASEQAEYERAIIENFHFPQNSWSWVVRGITIRGNHSSRLDDENFILGTGSSSSVISSDSTIIESCLFENQVKSNFLNIANGSHNIIYDCVIRDMNDCMVTYLAGNDIIGINIAASVGVDAVNNVILENEIYNVTDAIQLYNDGSGNNTGDMPGTLIYGNEMYNTRVYTDNCGEERMNGEGAIDIKQGTGSADVRAPIGEKVIIADNLFYGWRRSATEGLGRVFDGRQQDCVDLETHPSDGNCFHDQNGRGGGSGDAINCHINANNIAIINNTVTDCSNGFLIGAGGQIEIYNNTVCNLYPARTEYTANADYWINTIYSENVWPVNASNQYTIPACIQGFGDTYKIGHGIGEAIRISHPSCIVSGNRISRTIRGIFLNGFPAKKAVVTNNHINNIYTEDFYYGADNNPNDDNPDDVCVYENFSGNTYYNFTDLCWGGGNNPPANKVIENNSFYRCNGCKMDTASFSCNAECN